MGSLCTMDDLVLRHEPTVCFIECLTGDLGVGLHADTGAALEGIVRKLAAADSAACFLNLPRQDVEQSIDNPVVSVYRRVTAHHDIPSIDIGRPSHDEAADVFRDVVHTTVSGGKRMAGLILTELESILETLTPRAAAPLFDKDYSSARVVPVDLDALRDQANVEAGRFRLAYSYLEVAPDNELHFYSCTEELLGLLLVVGPHSGPTIIDGKRYDLRDRWCSYSRLHALVFEAAVPTDRHVAIFPLDDARGSSTPPSRVKAIGFLTRRA